MLGTRLASVNARGVILASQSPRRRELLDKIGLEFQVKVSSFEENLDKQTRTAEQYVVDTSRVKAMQIFEGVPEFEGVVIAADTVVVLDGEILEKPTSADHAVQMLGRLSGRCHAVYSGVTLVGRLLGESSRFEESFAVKTDVAFAELPTDVITAYVKSGEPMDKAGAYGIQGIGGSFVSGINGCYFNVMGLPIHAVCLALGRWLDWLDDADVPELEEEEKTEGFDSDSLYTGSGRRGHTGW
eukprot:TRINITY_DN76894_c0_g1_i1.p1 TRINITY_DN76894_c0_g1~~TRINITY_DN76894_c0_g1_i1.p1  ORF type:complete len:242 (+),score=32.86 TRINITY_DN76894_c0_g1_i1:72-797(+)